MPELLIQNRTLRWRHEVKKNLRHSYIVVNQEGVTLRSPAMAQQDAEALLVRKANWIFKKLDQIQPEENSPRLAHGSPVLLLGNALQLKLEQDNFQPLIRVWQEEQELVLQLPPRCQEHLSIREEAIQNFLRREALNWMIPRLEYWSETMRLYPRQVYLKRHKRRWGSCTARNEINLNYRAIQLPPRCIDSILVHELAHIPHKNHGARFWELVYQYIPDYKELDREIKTLAPRIL